MDHKQCSEGFHALKGYVRAEVSGCGGEGEGEKGDMRYARSDMRMAKGGKRALTFGILEGIGNEKKSWNKYKQTWFWIISSVLRVFMP